MVGQKSSAGTHGKLASKTLIVDSGAWTIKAGFSTQEPNVEADCREIQNCIARSARDKRTYIGSELDTCRDFGELAFRRPVEKGYVVNWEGEKAIWEHSFMEKSSALHCDPHDTNLLLTETPNAPTALQRNADEMVFEEFEFASYYRCTGPSLNAYAPSPFPSTGPSPSGLPLECLLVIDAGYSQTTVTPLLRGQPLRSASRRLEIGGKTLTNQLKELISTRTVDVSREDWIVNEIKHDCCYLSQTFQQDLEKTWKGGVGDRRTIDQSIVLDYVLPDYENLHRGFTRPHDPSRQAQMRKLGVGGLKEEVLTVGNERFTVPELLFAPGDIGMQQEGLCETVMQCMHALPEGLWQAFLANIIVVGGTAQIPGLMNRLEAGLRVLVPDDLTIRVAMARDPVKNAWLGGARLSAGDLQNLTVTRQEYLENGVAWVARKFAGKLAR